MKYHLIIITFLSVLLWPEAARAQENKFKAIFMYKFIEHTQWPGGKKDLIMGVIGTSEVAMEFEKLLKSKNITNINIKKITAAEAPTCDVVFIPSSSDGDFNSAYASTKGKSILLITEAPHLAKKGAGIGFLKENAKLGYVVNRTYLETCRLKVAQNIVNLAREVI